MPAPTNLHQDLRRAVAHFWKTRTSQGRRQGGKSGAKDAGARSMVTGGKQMDGFVSLFASIVEGGGNTRLRGQRQKHDASRLFPP